MGAGSSAASSAPVLSSCRSGAGELDIGTAIDVCRILALEEWHAVARSLASTVSGAPGDDWPTGFEGELARLQDLEPALREYVAEPPSTQAIAAAGHLLAQLVAAGLRPDAVVPAGDGGVVLAWPRKGWYAEIICDNEGEQWFQHRSSRSQPVSVEPVESCLTETMLERLRSDIAQP